MEQALVEMRRIRKRFGDLLALDDVSLTLRPGRVQGLLGENGAGKSTLMNVLYGMLRPDGGEILIDGRAADVRSPLDALRLGVGMVHQHFMLAGPMTVLDNVLLGDRRAPQWLDRRGAADVLRQISTSLGLAVDPFARVDELSVGGQQRVEILKAVYRDVRVLVLDEPTAVLTPAETQQLFAAVERLRAGGHSVVFISHKLGEIRRICDDLTVLRRGKVVFDGPAAGVSAEELSRHMVGHDVASVRATREPAREARVVLRVASLSLGPLRDVSLEVGAGEILGVAGVDGNGQQELAEAIVGVRAPSRGRVELDDVDVTRMAAARRFARGVAHVPNDRKREGLVGTMTVAENLVLKRHDRPPFSRGGVMRWRSVRRAAREMIGRFDVRPPSIGAPVGALSGGNAQKVILARELALSPPRLVVAMNPARGLDVAATQFVHEQLLSIRRAGGAVLLISSELDELLALCDRVGVLFGGRFAMSDFPRDGADVIGRMMTGAADAAAAGVS